jgi:hypothetical protein
VKPTLIVLEVAVALSAALEQAGLRHAIGGALALGYHVAEPRATRDIDINVSIDDEQPLVLFEALPAGLLWSDADVRRARRDGQVRLFWPLEEGAGPPLPVDLFLPQHELHAVVAERAQQVPMLDTSVPILSATDLTIFKALFDRPKDWLDIEAMLQFGKVDVLEVRRWLAEVVGPEDDRFVRLAEVLDAARRPHKEVIAADLFRRRQPRLGD